MQVRAGAVSQLWLLPVSGNTKGFIPPLGSVITTPQLASHGHHCCHSQFVLDLGFYFGLTLALTLFPLALALAVQLPCYCLDCSDPSLAGCAL